MTPEQEVPGTMNRRSILVGGAMLVAGCSRIAPEQGGGSAPPPDSDEWEVREDVAGSIAEGAHQNLVVRDDDFATAGEHARVRGTVRNTRDSAFPGVGVEVTLYSEEGDSIDSAGAESEDELEPEGEWEFAVVFESVFESREAESVGSYTMETGGDPSL